MADDFRTLFVDDHVVVVAKPSGLLSVPGRGPEKQDCLAVRVALRYPDALVVHRLDRDTSGVCMMARGRAAQSELGRQFQRKQIGKLYVADVQGRVASDQGRVDLPIGKDFENRPRYATHVAWAKPSLTRWRVLRRAAGRTRLLVRPFTGRSHQIRVHLSAIGAPIIGDPLYSSDPDPCERLRLHAWRLRFRHPATGRSIAFTSPPPFELEDPSPSRPSSSGQP